MQPLKKLSIEQNDSYMLGEETKRVDTPELKRFYRWRFVQGEDFHPAICPRCGRITDPDYVNAGILLRKKTFDLSYTYDGYLICSDAVRLFLQAQAQLSASVEFVPLPSAAGYSILRLTPTATVAVDLQRSGIRQENRCDQCNAYAGVFLGIVMGTPPKAMPLFLEQEAVGLVRTDLEFGSSHEQHPLLLVDDAMGELLASQGFKGLQVVDQC